MDRQGSCGKENSVAVSRSWEVDDDRLREIQLGSCRSASEDATSQTERRVPVLMRYGTYNTRADPLDFLKRPTHKKSVQASRLNSRTSRGSNSNTTIPNPIVHLAFMHYVKRELDRSHARFLRSIIHYR